MPRKSRSLSPDPLASFPPWARMLAERYYTKTISTFILHGAVRDLQPADDGKGGRRFISLRSFLADELFGTRDLVVFYDRSGGIRLANPEMQKDFMAAVSGYDTLFGTEYAKSVPKDPARAFPLLESYARVRIADGKSVAIIVDFAETVAPAGDLGYMPGEDRYSLVTLVKWAQDAQRDLRGERRGAGADDGRHVPGRAGPRAHRGHRRPEADGGQAEGEEEGDHPGRGAWAARVHRALLFHRHGLRARQGEAAAAAGRQGHPDRQARRGPDGLLDRRPDRDRQDVPGHLLRRRDRHPLREVPQLPLAVARRDRGEPRKDLQLAQGDVAGGSDHRRGRRLPRQPQRPGRQRHQRARVLADRLVHGEHRVPREDRLVPAHEQA